MVRVNLPSLTMPEPELSRRRPVIAVISTAIGMMTSVSKEFTVSVKEPLQRAVEGASTTSLPRGFDVSRSSLPSLVEKEVWIRDFPFELVNGTGW